tara:strand:+ start:547 stop:735 length:189 start_codon:yes stop_codon:yes gene_type:complete
MIDTFKKDYELSDIKVARLLGITRQAVWQYRTNKRPIPKTIINLLLLLKIKKNRALLEVIKC